jgi:hypothetical protein
MSFNVTTWIQQLGFLTNFSIYSASIGAVSLILPFMYVYGKPIRAWTAGSLEPSAPAPKDLERDERGWNEKSSSNEDYMPGLAR